MRLPRQLALGVTLFVAGARAGAESTELPLALDWQAPPECYSADMIRAELARIARVRPGRAPAKLSVEGRVEQVGDEYRLSLTLERNGDVLERRLASSECRGLGREVTLIVALAFGEGVELVPDEPGTPETAPAPDAAEKERAERSTPEPAAPAPADTDASAAPESAEDGGLRAAVFLGGGVLLRALPSAAARAFAGVELGWPHLWVAPELDLLLPVEDALERGVDARYDGLGGGLSFCLGEPALTALLAVCATGGARAVRGRSTGASESGSALAPWYTAGAAVSAAWPERGVLSLRLAAALLVSLNHPRFVIDGLGQAHAIPGLVPSLSSSLLLRL